MARLGVCLGGPDGSCTVLINGEQSLPSLAGKAKLCLTSRPAHHGATCRNTSPGRDPSIMADCLDARRGPRSAAQIDSARRLPAPQSSYLWALFLIARMTDCLVSRRGKTHTQAYTQTGDAWREFSITKELCLRSLQMETGSWFLLLNQRMI